jgi:kynurenine formamidase
VQIIDLSHPVHAGMQVHPGDPEVVVRQAATVERDGVNVLAVHCGSHTGTHVDAPFHVLPDGVRLDELDLTLFQGPAVTADLRDRSPRAAIGWSDLEPVAGRLRPGVVLVLHTGWSCHFGTPEYLRHPWLTREAAERVVAAGVRSLATDTLSPDPTPGPGAAPGDLPVHRAVLGAGGVIVENLTNVAALAGLAEPLLSFFPLSLAHADGAPVRAVAMQS